MPSEEREAEKRVIGLYGEMRLAMELHKRGWQVYRAYIDEKFDFVIMKSFCEKCAKFTKPLRRKAPYNPSHAQALPQPNDNSAIRTTVTNLCEECESNSLRMLVRFIQVKTSEGIPKQSRSEEELVKEYSFHPKIRYHLADGRVFYVWIQVWDEDHVNYYIFKTEDVEKFDDLSLPSYQITDNQKINLRINRKGKVLTKSRKYSYDYNQIFENFKDNFELFDQLIDDEVEWYNIK